MSGDGDDLAGALVEELRRIRVRHGGAELASRIDEEMAAAVLKVITRAIVPLPPPSEPAVRLSGLVGGFLLRCKADNLVTSVVGVEKPDGEPPMTWQVTHRGVRMLVTVTQAHP